MPKIIRVPQLGESITEAIVARWFKQVGDLVVAGEPVLELETDKITVEVPAPVDGVLRTRLAEGGATVGVGDPIAEIEEGAVAVGLADHGSSVNTEIPAAPTARAEARRRGLPLDEVEGSGRKGRVVKEDVVHAAELRAGAPTELAAAAVVAAAPNRSAPTPASIPRPPSPRPALDPAARETRVPMTTFRKRIAARLVAAQATAAILTTFNEVDMSAVRELRERHKQAFVDKHGVKLGFMSFFVKATVDALRDFPAINAEIQGDEVVYKNFFDIGVAVGGGKGLVVPVLRDCDRLGFAGIEREIARLAALARENRLQITDLEGGTFTISNGGIYGSMLSTPILNHPQSGILGLHNIVDRPVAIGGRVEIRPIMYLALSYDHRLVDGREAVQFLTHIKSAIEDPCRVMLEI